MCPNGPEFTALDLDEIRLERLQSIEDRIKQNIKDLKAKLNFHKKKRQTVERDRDLKVRLQRYVTGGAGENDEDEREGLIERNILEQENLFASPIRSVPDKKVNRAAPAPAPAHGLSSPSPSRLIEDKREEKREDDDEKEEEKEDLWQMWNKVASHKIASKKGSGEGMGRGMGEEKAERKKSYQSIRYENKADRKEFLSSMLTEQSKEREEKATEEQWQSRTTATTTAATDPSKRKDQVVELLFPSRSL